jgi:hypothetical protein
MKGMADEIQSLGEELSNRHLVLQLRGLNKKYGHMKALIKRTKPLPSFHTIRNDLKLEELDMETEADPTSATALYAAPSTRQQQQQPAAPTASFAPPSSYAPTSGPPSPAAPPTSTNKSKGKGKDKGGGGDPISGNTSSANTGGGGGTPAWSSFYNPWMGSINMWPGPRPPQQLPCPQQTFLATLGPFGPPSGPRACCEGV